MARQLFNQKGFSYFDESDEAQRYFRLLSKLVDKLRDGYLKASDGCVGKMAKEMIAGDRDWPEGFTWHDLKQLMSEEDWEKLKTTVKPSSSSWWYL